MIKLRAMDSGDIAAGLELCRANGWNQTEREWQLFVDQKPTACLVAVDESGNTVGTVTTLQFGPFSWIGMLLVSPAHQRQGTGNKLLTGAMDLLKGRGTMKLDATAAGRAVYLKLQFQDEFAIHRMLLKDPDWPKPENDSCRLMAASDWKAVTELDVKIFGADRTKVLQWLWNSSPQLAWVLYRNGVLSACCFGRQGHLYTQIGPVLAIDSGSAKEVTRAALRRCNAPVILDVPSYQPSFENWLTDLGFTLNRELIRMYRGNATQTASTNLYAIAGPELG